ncbi:conserved hypothetical protein [uncultured Desulfobacterium sp.]|uniref:Uncharacterized protein n=1 Tax=uncultured Desulfobacterium sp. TaxID=201089 RepID=A0A445N359_9BACT|nr:conserved hypothetical protein [uncultured Desulfobacterium sp.]
MAIFSAPGQDEFSMQLKRQHIGFLLPALIFFFMTVAISCTSKEAYEGVYAAQGGRSEKYSNSQLELKEKGVAVWSVPNDEVSFRWDVKGSEIWLSSKSGGIIIGKIKGDTIEVTLPGAKEPCFFKKMSVR